MHFSEVSLQFNLTSPSPQLTGRTACRATVIGVVLATKYSAIGRRNRQSFPWKSGPIGALAKTEHLPPPLSDGFKSVRHSGDQ
jgi:hypothetical protein